VLAGHHPDAAILRPERERRGQRRHVEPALRRRGDQRGQNGAHARVQVSFERQGTKWLMVQYANLEPL